MFPYFLSRFTNMEWKLNRKLQLQKSVTQVSYILRKINTFIANDKNNNDFDIEMFEKSFKNNLKQYDVVLSDLEFPKD